MADAVLASRTRACKGCGNDFDYEVRPGMDRLYCSRRCADTVRSQKWNERPKPDCTVDGCGKPAANLTCGFCHAHYARMRRKGHLDLAQPPRLIGHSHGYKLLYAPKHALGTDCQQSRVYEHRAVYHAEHGDGPFDCYHCGVEVDWSNLHIDHLNDDRADNRLDNLVASCPTCNQKRGVPKLRIAARRRSKRQITWRGQTRCIAEWAEHVGLTRSTISQRLRAGWTVDRTLTEPRGIFGPKGR